MPMNHADRYAKTFKDAEFWRKEATKWEHLATMADNDGDEHYASAARREAAGCRQNARLRELEQNP